MTLLVDNVVPFTAQGRLDPAMLRAHVLWLVGHGVSGFLPGASEMLTLDAKEKEQVIEVVSDAAVGRTVLYPCWDPASGRVVKLAEAAAAHGAAGVVVPPPLLHPAPEDAIVEWYRALARNVKVPLYAWHHPRFGNDLSPALIGRLRAEAGVEGWLDASGDFFRIRRLAATHPGRAFAFADDEPQVAGAAVAGVVSRLANCWPDLVVRAFVHKEPLADAVHLRAQHLARAGGVPALKRLLGMPMRLPMVGVDEGELARLPAAGFP
ncbi:MAG: dihydrodipicolinate synthase family protein [Myxococcota bacterium]